MVSNDFTSSPRSLLLLTSSTCGAGVIKNLSAFDGMASARIQLLPLIAAADKLNFSHRIFSIDVNNPDCINHLGRPSVCFIGKINHHSLSRFHGFALSVLASIARLKANSVPIGVLYCDHLAASTCARGDFYRDLLKLADLCIVPCNAMKQRVLPYFNKPSLYVIEDPIQVSKCSYPKLKRNQPFHIGWFGSINNVNHVIKNIESLLKNVSAPPSVRFSVLTNQHGLNLISDKFFDLVSKIDTPIPWILDQHLWIESQHPYLLQKFLEPLHLVWLPVNPNNVVKQAVSHNRLVDSIQSGSIVVSNTMESYLELSSVALLSSNYSLMINSAYVQYNRLSLKHDSLRDSAISRFKPEHNIAQWQTLLKSLSFQ